MFAFYVRLHGTATCSLRCWQTQRHAVSQFKFTKSLSNLTFDIWCLLCKKKKICKRMARFWDAKLGCLSLYPDQWILHTVNTKWGKALLKPLQWAVRYSGAWAAVRGWVKGTLAADVGYWSGIEPAILTSRPRLPHQTQKTSHNSSQFKIWSVSERLAKLYSGKLSR